MRQNEGYGNTVFTSNINIAVQAIKQAQRQGLNELKIRTNRFNPLVGADAVVLALSSFGYIAELSGPELIVKWGN